MLPSTGDFNIPTIRRSCCQGDVLVSLTVPNLVDHSALSWLQEKKINNQNELTPMRCEINVQILCFEMFIYPWKQEAVLKSQFEATRVASQTWTSSLNSAACQGQSPGSAILLKLCVPFLILRAWSPHSECRKYVAFLSKVKFTGMWHLSFIIKLRSKQFNSID